MKIYSVDSTESRENKTVRRAIPIPAMASMITKMEEKLLEDNQNQSETISETKLEGFYFFVLL